MKRPLRGLTSGYPCYTLTSKLCAENNPSGTDTSVPYRWMLDKVTDPYGNDMVYKYEKLKNQAKTIGDATNEKEYDADAVLSEVLYGRASNASIGSFRDKVTFTYVRRCTQAISTNLDSSCPDITNGNGASYPDVPTDLYCPTATSCSNYPSFFHTKRLVGIATYTSANGSSWSAVAQWRLTPSFPETGDYTNEKLFLESVQRMDPATSPVGADGTALMPAIRFGKTAFNNREDGSVSGGVSFQPIFRVTRITDELGKEISIAYVAPTEVGPTWREDTSNTYPRWITWGSSAGWGEFRKWSVDYIKVRDLVTGPAGQSGDAVTPTQVWDYTYNGGAAKRYTPDYWFEDNNRSYNVWRGFGEIVITHGCGTGPFASGTACHGEPGGQAQTVTKTRYYRGMDADRVTSTTVSDVKLAATWTTSSEVSIGGVAIGTGVDDQNWLAGQVFEEFRMDGTGTSYLSSTRNYALYFDEQPGISVKSGLSRWYRKSRVDLTYRRLRDGTAGSPTWRDRRIDTSYEPKPASTTDHTTPWGRPLYINDTGFLDTSGDETCTATTYLTASSEPTTSTPGWMGLVAGTASYPTLGTQPTHAAGNVGSCGSGVVTAQTATFYNANAYSSGSNIASAAGQSMSGTAKPSVTAVATRLVPQVGSNDVLTNWSVSRSTYDTAGRVTSTIDPLGDTTSYSFDSTYGYPNAATYPISGIATSTEIDPATGQPTSKTDQNGNTTTLCYDNMGRLTQAYVPGQTVNCAATYASSTAAAKFSYDIGSYANDTTTRTSKTPAIVVTSVRQSATVSLDAAAYVDGHGRTRETQTSSPTSGKIIVSGVSVLDDRGNAVTSVEPFAITDTAPGDRTSPTGASLGFAAWPSLLSPSTLNSNVTVFDTANRATSTARKYGTTTLVTTSTTYKGTRTETTPQVGSMAASVVDAYGRTIRSEVYNGTTPPSAAGLANPVPSPSPGTRGTRQPGRPPRGSRPPR